LRKRPTEAELAILQVPWTRGPSTVREVHDHLNGERPTGYTTTIKRLQIMADKDLVRRDETERAHVHAAHLPKEQAQSQLVRDVTTDRIREMRKQGFGKLSVDQILKLRRSGII
jgi:BlaI family transcriptional regulator, penicillinase repressor